MFSPKAKRAMTSFDLAAIVQELRGSIVGSKIDNVYQLSPFTLLLSFRSHHQLVFELGRRFHLTRYELAKPSSPSLFCRILRKFLSGGTVQEVRMEGFERIATLKIGVGETFYELVCEVFGKGNLILVDAGGVILHASSYRKMRDRQIIRGEHLKPPPSSGYSPLEITRQEFEALREQKGEVVRALSRLLAVGGLYSEELLLRADVDKHRDVASLTVEELDRLYRAVKSLASDLAQPAPHIVVDGEGRWVDALPFCLKVYFGFKAEGYPAYNEAADDYFTKLSSEGESEAYREVTGDIEEQERILGEQRRSLESLAKEAEESQRIGDALYLHTLEVQGLLRRIAEERANGIPWDRIVAELKELGKEAAAIAVSSADLQKGTLSIVVEGLAFELSVRKSVFENAASFYERAKEAKLKIERLKEAMAETESKIKSLGESRLRVEREEAAPTKLREKLWFEKFHWAKSSDNLLIIGGRDATTNELLIKRYMEDSDLVFHADVSGAPFVLLKTEGKTPSEQTIFEAAQLAASYSRGWREGWASLDAYWVRPEQVSAEAPSGEYLSKGMFMIRGQKNYVHNVPLRLSIGVEVEEEENGDGGGGNLSVIGGPVSAVGAHARYKVDVVPGRRASGEMAKMIRGSLAANATKELREAILKLRIEDIQQFLPAGKSEIDIK